MDCQEIKRKLCEYLDGELPQQQAKEIQEHLKKCPSCLSFLEELKLIETEAKNLKIEEPTQEYWDNFSLRVKEKIRTIEENSFAFKLKKFFENIFTFSPTKIKWATGLASILLIFVVGILWLQKKGVEQIPTERKISTIGTVDTLPKEKIIKEPSPALEETKEIGKREEKKLIGAIKIEPPKVAIPKPAESEEALKTLELPQQQEFSKLEANAPGGAKPQSIEVITEKPAITKDVTTPENVRAGKAGESLGIVSPKDIEPVPESTLPAHTLGFVKSAVDKKGKVRELSEIDTALTEKEIRPVLDFWKKYISEKPDTAWVDKAIEQVSIGYYLLAKSTQKKEFIDEGISTLEKYIDKVTSPDTRTKVQQKIQEIKNLK